MQTSPTVRQIQTPAGDPAWLVTGYDTVKALLADPRLGRSHPDPSRAARLSDSVILGQPSSSQNEHEEHARMRRLLGPAFSARRMETLREGVQELLDGLLDAMEREPRPLDFHEAVSFPLPVLVICQLLGVPYEDRADFRRWSDDAADMTDGARSRAGWAGLLGYMGRLVERKRTEPAEDVLSDLTAPGPDGTPELDATGAAQLGAGLLFAGHETTVAAIDRGVLLLLTNPDQREALERDPDRLKQAVEEILRHPGPLQRPEGGRGESPIEQARSGGGIPRYANADLEVGGVTIKAGDLVLLGLRAANQDEDRFTRPEEFAVAREQNAHLTFGHGPHFCLGAPLARLELQTVFGTLLGRFPGLRLARPVEELQTRSHLLTGGVEELPVTW